VKRLTLPAKKVEGYRTDEIMEEGCSEADKDRKAVMAFWKLYRHNR